MNKVRLLICLVTLALLTGFTQRLAAQEGVKRTILRGKVTDAQSHLPLIGATVVEMDKDNRTVNGTVTDIDGNYALRVTDPEHNRLSTSYLNYKTLIQNIHGRTQINVPLTSDAHSLTTVTITAGQNVDMGTGLQISDLNSTLSTASIQEKDLENLSTPNVGASLAGRLPGVDVSTTSGDPGAGLSIRIRGTATINGSANPLIILDGMPYNTEIPSDFNFGTADEQGYAQLLNIAPSDIQSITVLKDAAATAMWGSKAANGVLVITTKRGKIGKPSVSYSLKGTYSRQPTNIPLLSGDQYATLIPEEVSNAGKLPLDIDANKEFSFDPKDPYWYYNYSNNTDWVKAITQTGYSQEHDVSMTGGGEKARYYASIGYYDQQGTTVGTGLGRITSKINLDYDVSKRIHFRSDITYTHLDNTLNYVPDKNYQVRGVAYDKMPNMAIYEYDIYGNRTPNYFSPASNIQGQYNTTYNPVALAKEGIYKQQGERITPTFNLQYQVVPSVLLSTFDVEFDINNTQSHTFLPQDATGRPYTESVVNQAANSDGDVIDVYTKTNFIYTPKKNDEDHELQALLSIQTEDMKDYAYNAKTSNTASPDLQYTFNPSRADDANGTLSSTRDETRSIGVLLQGQYDLLNKYMLNAGIRGDGNSRFGPNYRYGLFPSASLRWRISGENFMKPYKFVNDFSFRASYGQAGSAPPDKAIWNYYNTYEPYSYSYMGLSGVSPTNIELNNLKWQTLIGSNLGFDLSLFDNRFKLDVDWYDNRIKDMFYDNLTIPSYTGFSTLPENVGTMDNRGWEVFLNTIPVKTKNWQVGFNLDISRNTNVIRSISPFFPRESVTSVNTNGEYKTYLQIGNPFGSFYGFQYEGVYTDKDATIARDAGGREINGSDGQPLYMRFDYPAIDYTFQPGDAKYKDVNHDGNINDQDIVYLGNGLPKLSGGFGFDVTYKDNLKLTTFFNSRLDYDVVDQADMNLTNMYSFDNQSTAVLKRWRNPGDVTNVPRALYKSGYNWLGSSRYVHDASFLRLQAITLRYTLGQSILNTIKIRSASVYVTVENLYTWTKYPGENPDVSIIGDNDPFSYPVDNALTPPSKNILLGINVNF